MGTRHKYLIRYLYQVSVVHISALAIARESTYTQEQLKTQMYPNDKLGYNLIYRQFSVQIFIFNTQEMWWQHGIFKIIIIKKK